MKKLTTKNQHLVKAQLYRWYQLYERPMNEKRISNQLEMLDENIIMINPTGKIKGTAAYPERLKGYDGWQNAHHIKNINVSLLGDNTLGLEVDLHYQNIKPNGEKQSYALKYKDARLERTTDSLPKFTRIEIIPVGATEEDFEDAYPTNRTKSLMYYWIALMENLDGNVNPFKELLADNFILNFSTESKITTITKLEKWLNGTPKQLQNSEHKPKNFSVKEIMENEFEMTVEFDWKGKTKEGQHLEGTTKHIWYILDNPDDRFAKILKADVIQINPLKAAE
ncbi:MULTISPECIES: hypothetical protein [unclassified Algibacter]|uniref:hypothetical protein n=1 Tax=unclassified Algibacter TaxID=2615009 RepID=UPI00131C426B|nr:MULTISPECIES: hypothetical protein [unclassified Algibacter]MCL5129550.1 hypothetical protein [Algibacter sp. L4_22]